MKVRVDGRGGKRGDSEGKGDEEIAYLEEVVVDKTLDNHMGQGEG